MPQHVQRGDAVNLAPAVLHPGALGGIRARLMLVLSLSIVLVGIMPSTVSAGWLSSTWPAYGATPNSEAARVLEIAHAQIGKRFMWGAAGPNAFDCSGLVWYAFKTAGLADRMGGKRRGAVAYLKWFKENGRISTNLADARPGDILIWGGGRHSGIYISDNWAISSLNRRLDIRIHRANPMGLPFTAVLLVDMSRTDDASSALTAAPPAIPTDVPTPDPAAIPEETPASP